MLGLLLYFAVPALVTFVFCLLVGRWWAIVPPILLWLVVILLSSWVEGDYPGSEPAVVPVILIGGAVAALGGCLGMATREQMRGRGA